MIELELRHGDSCTITVQLGDKQIQLMTTHIGCIITILMSHVY